MNKYLLYMLFSAIVHTQLYSQKIIISPEKLNEKAQRAHPNSLEKQKVFSLNYLIGIEYFRIDSKLRWFKKTAHFFA
ncbi:hypothetical protein VB776_24340 [Arcicella sp. DC2W]|uniref:Uncharacterized protein n=1 Tax=Arcicella gelida TaxID=2984195 RepID=A0ABU5SCK9_9BACT|nr:hypothetical protein [Arcicella sp. DC2W]MEA5406091.1 hypothetical protein [Arcicella sp. DC2W]